MAFYRAKGNLVAFLAGITFLSAVLVPPLAFNSGLDTAQPVGKFLNGVFPPTPPIALEGEWMASNAFPGLDFTSPIAMVQEPGTERMILAEHGGTIWSFENTHEASQKSIFLDISDRVGRQGEAGFLNFAFHPQYEDSKPYLYAFYVYRDSTTKRLYERVSRFEVLPDSGFADPASEWVLIHQFDRQDSHNGGGFFFGTDGYLYIAVGDEGGARNPWQNAQTIDDRLFGGILRIDVDQDSSRSHPIKRQPQRIDSEDSSFTAHFFIPNDNPWVRADSSVLEEFYAIGLRNPHRISQDLQTGVGYIGDVGQGIWEEIDLLEKGANYQWSYKQGNADMKDPKPDSTRFVGVDSPPIHTYVHKNGDNCVIGGFVYRGQKFPELEGRYLFADNGSKKIRALVRGNDTSIVEELLAANVGGSGYQGISSLATDRSGEIYLLVFNGAGEPGGKVYKIDREQGTGMQFPPLLSQTGAFTDMQNVTPAAFLIPYEPIESFWSDGMLKKRWMVIPNDGKHDTKGEKIHNSNPTQWQFPQGSVFIKHFELPLVEGRPEVRRKVETRFLIHGEDGKYYGVTYRWFATGQDAELLETGLDEEISFQGADGSIRSQIWHYPSRDACFSCHKEEVGTVLGAQHSQLNWDIIYPLTGRVGNQLHTLNSLEMFSDSLTDEDIASVQTMVHSQDTLASLETRAKSYLEANCANCHAPGTGLRSEFDTRFETSLDASGLIYGRLLQSVGNSTHLIVPGDTASSDIYQRLKSLEDGIAMPPLSKNIRDEEGIKLIGAWIMSLGDTFGIERQEDMRLVQEISFTPIPNKLVSDPPFPIHSEASSGLPIDITILSGPATLVNDSLYLLGEAGRVILELSQRGDSIYRPSKVRLSFLAQRTQDLSFPTIPNKLALDPSFELQAISSSGLTVNYAVIQGPASVLGNEVALSGVSGSVIVEARQEGNEEFAAALPVQKSFTVNKVPQQIIFPEPGELFVNTAPFPLQAFSDSRIPVQFSLLEGPATLSGDTLYLTRKEGTIRYAAWVAGDTTYLPSDTLYRTIVVKKAPQGLVFRFIPDLEIFSDPHPLEAYAGSGNPVAFKVKSGPVEIDKNNRVIPTGVGRVAIEAFQSGDSVYLPVTQIRNFEITKATQEIEFPALANKIISDEPFLLEASSSSGLSVHFLLDSGPVLLSGKGVFLLGEPGVVSIIAIQEGDAFHQAASPVVQSFEVIDTTQADPNALLTSEASDLGKRTNLRVYPNPATNQFFVQMVHSQPIEVAISLFSSTGQEIIRGIPQRFQGIFQDTYSIDGLSTGIYWLQIQETQNRRQIIRIPVVKQ